jgi:lipopolysaccharide export system permease protein
MAPLLILGTFISIFNFYTVSELATLSHLKANFLKSELRSINPLLLLHNKPLMQLKGIFYDAKGGSKLGQSASNIILALPDEKKHLLNLFIAGELTSSDTEFSARQLSMITPLKSKEDENLDDILLETIPSAVSSVEDFSQLIQKKVYQITNDSLNMGFLLLRRTNFKAEPATLETQKSIRHIDSEIARRISAGLSPLTFTLLGAAFGMSISRIRKRFTLAFPIGLASLYLICFFSGKAAEGNVLLAYCLFLVPHAIIIAASLYKIEKISQGTA